MTLTLLTIAIVALLLWCMRLRARAARYLVSYRNVSNELNAMHQAGARGFARHNLRLKQEATFWQGKFALVKHENNQLRKKLAKGVQ